MKLKTKVSLILIFLVIAVCSLFAACQIGGTPWEEIVGKAKNQHITYYACGGTFSNSTKTVKDIYYYAGTPTLEKEDDALSVTYTNWVFNGWYYLDLDEDGNPQYASEEDRKKDIPLLTDEQVVFPINLKENEHISIGVKWLRDYKIKYFLREDSSDITVDGKVYKVSDEKEFAEEYFSGKSFIALSYTRQPVAPSDATLVDYYVSDGEGGYEVPEANRIYKPAEYDETNEDPYVAVYCKYISGNWSMVRTASDARNMLNNLATGNKYYITGDIDCSGNTALPLKTGSTKCTIQGNGYTISNQKFSATSLSAGTYSVFGMISEEASITDLTFNGFTVEVTIRGSRLSIYLFSHGIAAGATLDNVVLKDSTLAITRMPDTTVIENFIQQDGVYTEDWIFGNGDYSGVTYDKLTLKDQNGATLDIK